MYIVYNQMRKNLTFLENGQVRVKQKDGKTQTFKKFKGTRAEVFHETAYETSGGLQKKDLVMNESRNEIVSVKKQTLAHTQKHLGKYLQRKGSKKFGPRKTRKNKNKKD
jgi:hypothetical protein